MRDARRGDQAAWADLVARLGPQVLEVAHAMHLRGADADEVFQATFVCLLRDLPHLRDDSAVGGWTYVTARRQAWRLKRRRAGRREDGEPDDVVGDEVDPARESESLEQRRLVREALASLSETCRRLLQALYFDRDSSRYDDVAERLGIPRGSIGPTRERCLAGLARILERHGFSGEIAP